MHTKFRFIINIENVNSHICRVLFLNCWPMDFETGKNAFQNFAKKDNIKIFKMKMINGENFKEIK